VGGIIVGATLAFMGGAMLGGDEPRRAAPVVTAAPAAAPAPEAVAAEPVAAPTSPAPPQPPAEPPSAWRYDMDEDPMTSAKTYFATVLSSNTIELGSPYGGPQYGTLMLRTHPRHGKDVIFRIQRGQILCRSYDGCTVLVRFDDDEPVRYNANGASDNSTETIFLSNYSGFAERMMKAERVRIAVEIYRSGTPVFEFNVKGFDVTKYRPD
jgi:hypothetical protein